MAIPITHCASASEFEALVMEPRGVLVVVEFWGHDCPNCELYEAHEAQLLSELDGSSMRYVKVNAYVVDELATRFAIYGIPTFVLVRDGVVIGRMTSFKGRDYWLAVVREHLPS